MDFDNKADRRKEDRKAAEGFTQQPRPILPVNDRGQGNRQYVCELRSATFHEANGGNARLDLSLKLIDKRAPWGGHVYRVTQWVNEDVEIDGEGQVIMEEGRAKRTPGSYSQFVTKMNALVAHLGIGNQAWKNSQQLTDVLNGNVVLKMCRHFGAQINTKTVETDNGTYQNHTLGFIKGLPKDQPE